MLSGSRGLMSENHKAPQIHCVLLIRESFTKEYGSRVFHSSPCGPLVLHIEPNQLSHIKRTHCTISTCVPGIFGPSQT